MSSGTTRGAKVVSTPLIQVKFNLQTLAFERVLDFTCD